MTVKKVFQQPVIAIALLALSSLSSCGGGGGSGASVDTASPSLATAPVTYVSPDDSAPVLCCAVEFTLKNGSPAKYTGGVYQITLYDDKAGLVALASSEALTENAKGEVRWASTVTLDENRAYWWNWTARYATGVVTSPQGVFHVTKKNALKAIAPRNTGWMDSNFAAQPTFAALNAYSSGETQVSYDFEVYANEALTIPVTSIVGLPQEDARYTTWRPSPMTVPLNKGATYYWRVRATLNGFTTGWAGPYSFTVQNPCAITGDWYASYSIDLAPRRQCSELSLTDPDGALGPSDAGGPPWRNFVSIDDGGEVTFEMGATMVDRPGPDIRVYQYIANEPLEVLVGPTEVGPWYSMGTSWCNESCDFDLDSAWVAYARYVKIRDLSSPLQDCHQTSGADIDSIRWIRPTFDTGECAAFGGDVASPTVKELTEPIVHSAPEWMKGVWNLVEIGMGTDYTGYEMTFTVTDTGFEYSYPGCYVKGRLSMEPKAMMTAANAYTMVMDYSSCVQQWDIATFAGNIDIGYIWALPGGRLFYRSSFYSGIDFWVYQQ